MSPFFNTMGQSNTMSPNQPRRGQLGGSLPNTMGQYHGGYPWFCTFWALLPIHDMSRYFPRSYATSPRPIRVYKETYSFHHILSTFWIPFFIAFCTHCRNITFSSLSTTLSSKLSSSSSSGFLVKDNTQHHIVKKHQITKSIKSRIASSGGLPSRTTHVNSRMSSSPFSGLPSRTTLCIIFPTQVSSIQRWQWVYCQSTSQIDKYSDGKC